MDEVGEWVNGHTESEPAKRSAPFSVGSIILTVALAACGFVVMSFAGEQSNQDGRIDRLEEERAPFRERMAHMESDLSHIKEATTDTGEEVKAIRRLLEANRSRQ